MFDLIHRARFWRLVRPPPQEFRAVAESPAGEVVVLHFDDELRIERFPLAAALRAPAARPARCPASEPAALARRLFQLLDPGREVFALLRGERGTEADVV